jgi:hypothetical protein
MTSHQQGRARRLQQKVQSPLSAHFEIFDFFMTLSFAPLTNFHIFEIFPSRIEMSWQFFDMRAYTLQKAMALVASD